MFGDGGGPAQTRQGLRARGIDSTARWHGAIVISIALHLGLTRAFVSAARRAAPAAPTPSAPDTWAGTTFDIDAILEQQASDRSTAAEPASARPDEPEPEAPPVEQAAPVEPPPQDALAKPAPSASSDLTPAMAAAPIPSRDPAPTERQDARGPAREAALGTEKLAADSGNASVETPPGEASPPGRSTADRVYGAQDLPPGVRDLGYAFLRAVPQATHTDPIWDRLPIGYEATLLVVLETSPEGRVTEAAPVANKPGNEVPRELKRLVRRTVALLGAGRFALPGGVVSAGRQALRLRVLLAQGTASDDMLAEPGDLVELHHDLHRPSEEAPSRAYFRKASGRRLDVWVWIASAAR